jgi:hypothetical protein
MFALFKDDDFVPLMEWQLPFVGRPVSSPVAGQPVHADYQKSTEQQTTLSFRPVCCMAALSG